MFDAAVEEGEEITFLTADDVEFIHEVALTEGGLVGYPNPGYIDAAVGRPRNVHLYENETDLIRLAAYLCHGIGTAHGFADANKRTAVLSALSFLEANGIEAASTVDAKELGRWVEACFEEGRFEVPILDHWFRTHCRWITE